MSVTLGGEYTDWTPLGEKEPPPESGDFIDVILFHRTGPTTRRGDFIGRFVPPPAQPPLPEPPGSTMAFMTTSGYNAMAARVDADRWLVAVDYGPGSGFYSDAELHAFMVGGFRVIP